MRAPGLGESQRAILLVLKRESTRTVPELSRALGLNVETLRGHLRTLEAHGLVVRQASRRGGRGRPEHLYSLSPDGEQLFPRREAEVLRSLVSYLHAAGRDDVVLSFFEDYIGSRRGDALARVAGLEGRERVEESAKILTELGFMAEVVDSPDGARLRLCNCPLRELVTATRIPCRVEHGFVQDLLGEAPIRVSHLADGAPACSYRVER